MEFYLGLGLCFVVVVGLAIYSIRKELMRVDKLDPLKRGMYDR